MVCIVLHRNLESRGPKPQTYVHSTTALYVHVSMGHMFGQVQLSCMQGYNGQAVAKQRGEITYICVSTYRKNNALSVSQLHESTCFDWTVVV